MIASPPAITKRGTNHRSPNSVSGVGGETYQPGEKKVPVKSLEAHLRLLSRRFREKKDYINALHSWLRGSIGF